MRETNKARAGDHVFANVDLVLAEKIISRSKENSESAGADASASAPSSVLTSAPMPDVNDGVGRRREPVSFVKLAIPVVLAVVVLALLIFRRKGK